MKFFYVEEIPIEKEPDTVVLKQHTWPFKYTIDKTGHRRLNTPSKGEVSDVQFKELVEPSRGLHG